MARGKLVAALSVSLTGLAWAQCGDGWERGLGLPGVASSYTTAVHAQTEWDPDGPGPEPSVLVVAGYIESANGLPVKWVAAWDGIEFKPMGSGFDRWVYALAVWNGELYAGGAFDSSGGTPCSKIARWNGAAWESVGGGLAGGAYDAVRSLSSHNGDLIAAGTFTHAGSGAANVASWDGATWSSVGWPGPGVHAAASFGGDLYVGGEFTTGQGAPASYTSRRNGSTWGFGCGTNAPVYAMTVHDGTLIVGGSFTGPTRRVGAWNGTFLAPFATGTDSTVLALHTHHGRLHAGGYFTEAGGVTAHKKAVWNGGAWEPIGGVAFDAATTSFSTWRGDLCVGTGLGAIAGRPFQCIGRYGGFRAGPDRSGQFGDECRSLCVYQNQLYAGGYDFSGDVTAVGSIARWNGTSWEPLGDGLAGRTWTQGPVTAAFDMVEFNGLLVVGGSFTHAGSVAARSVAAWDGTSWSAVGSGMDYAVRSLAVFDGELHAAGEFQSADGAPAHLIAKWNGSSWQALTGETPVPDRDIYELAVFDGRLIAGGRFDALGGVPISNVGAWDGTAWSALGTVSTTPWHGVRVSSIAEYQGQLHIGGFVGRTNVTRTLMRWDGAEWHDAIPGHFNNEIEDLLVRDGKLIVAGQFQAGPDQPVSFLGEWDGTTWSAVPETVNQWVRALGEFEGNLVAAGGFTEQDGRPATHIATWERGWSPMGKGFDGPVNAWCWHNGELYAAGNFAAAGGTSASRIARRVGKEWEAVGTGIQGSVRALVSHNGLLIAAGSMSQAGGQPVSNIAAWDGAAWQPLGGGVISTVNALAVYGADLIAAGAFWQAGGASVNYVARWDGGAWHAMGAGFDSGAGALLVGEYNGVLYAGGNFTHSGATVVNGIAQWDGAAWQPVGGGLGPYRQVKALLERGPYLIAGGYDIRLGNTQTCVASWDGTSWSPLGDPGAWGACFPAVQALAVYDGAIVAGGAFSCGSVGNNLAWFDGGAWRPAGGGAAGSVNALTVDGGALLIGGTFITVEGGIASSYIARWSCDIGGCVADYDHNGFVNGDDFDTFVVDFDQGLPGADIDLNTYINGDDFDIFVQHFSDGC